MTLCKRHARQSKSKPISHLQYNPHCTAPGRIRMEQPRNPTDLLISEMDARDPAEAYKRSQLFPVLIDSLAIPQDDSRSTTSSSLKARGLLALPTSPSSPPTEVKHHLRNNDLSREIWHRFPDIKPSAQTCTRDSIKNQYARSLLKWATRTASVPENWEAEHPPS